MHPHGRAFEHAIAATEPQKWARLEAKSATVEADLLRALEPNTATDAHTLFAAVESAVAWLTTLADS